MKSITVKNLMMCILCCLMPIHILAQDKVETQLDRLDDVLSMRQEILSKKQIVVSDLKQSLGEKLTHEDLTEKYEQIYSEYLHLNGDSAITYAEKAVKAAAMTHDASSMLSARFCLLRAYTRQGAMGKAYATIGEIGDIRNLPQQSRRQYADILLDFYNRVRGKVYGGEVMDINSKEAWKRYSPYLGSGSVEYCFYETFYTGHCNIKKIEATISKSPEPSFNRASLYYVLAFGYLRRHNTDKFYSCLIRSAINDVLLGNTETASLLELLKTPLMSKDLKRSYAYVQVCADNVKLYNDMLRALSVISVQGRINKQFDDARSRQMTIIIIIASLFLIALVISVIEYRLLARRGKKVRQSVETLKEMHDKQKSLTQEQLSLTEKLKEVNARLSDRLAAYRKDFLNVYQLVSSYITYEKSVRNNILNQLKTNSVRKAIRDLESNDGMNEQLKLFYSNFDHAFLSMYPDFIHRINTLLDKEHRFDESQQELTTPLRIYALHLLGITDSVGIADYLHLSSQTIYNYRLKMRRCAANDEKRFDDEVSGLYG